MKKKMKDLQRRLDIANRTVCLQIDAINESNHRIDELYSELHAVKSRAFDLLSESR
jgi:hypothetical protein